MERRKLLTPEERQALLGVPDDEESLIRHYTLSPQDRLQAEVRRRPHNQLGFAVQLCLMRYPGRPLGVDECPPAAMVAYVAQQLGIDPTVLCCMDRIVHALNASGARIQVMRTDLGRPSSSMRFKA